VSENWKKHILCGEYAFSCMINAGGYSAPGGLETKIKLLNIASSKLYKIFENYCLYHLSSLI
jgi:hypothetical protein